MADIVEAWMWRDPGEVIDRLLARSARLNQVRPVIGIMAGVPPRTRRDRHYTAWRRLHVKQLMRAIR